MSSVLYGALVALYAGLGGAYLAYLCITWHPVAAIVPIVVLAAAGYGSDLTGERLFWRSPKTALAFKEGWILLPATVAAAATCLLILLKQEVAAWPFFGVGDAVKDQNAAIAGPISDAVVAFVGAIVLKAASDADSEWLAPRIADAFGAHYQRGVPTATTESVYFYDERLKPRLDLAVNSEDVPGGGSGWGVAERWARVRVIAASL